MNKYRIWIYFINGGAEQIKITSDSKFLSKELFGESDEFSIEGVLDFVKRLHDYEVEKVVIEQISEDKG